MRVEDHHITGRQSAWWDTLHIVERELLRIRMAVEASGSNILSGSEVHYVAPPADQLHGSGAVHFAKNWGISSWPLRSFFCKELDRLVSVCKYPYLKAACYR